MNAFLSKTANVSLLALAALPIIALGFAHAAPVSIKVSDLNLSRPADVRVLDARIDHTASQICVSSQSAGDLTQLAACRKAVRAEAMDQLSTSQAQANNASPAVG